VNIDFVRDSNLIKYSVRLFYDDFQSLLNSKYNTYLNFGKQTRMTMKEQESMLNYINSALIIKGLNSTGSKSEFLGWKVEDLSVWLFFRVKVSSDITELVIENRLMLEIFADQKNLLILNTGNEEKGYNFDQRTIYQQISLL
jgi:hypothetical protein